MSVAPQSPRSPFAEWFGLEIIDANAESALLHLQLLPHHLNRFGVAHGGVTLSLADHACGAVLAAMCGDQAFFATTNFYSTFHKAAQPGLLECRARLKSRSRLIAHIDADVFQQGELLLSMKGSFAIRERYQPKS